MAKAAAKTKPMRGDVLLEVAKDTAVLFRKEKVWMCKCSKTAWRRHDIAGRIVYREECVEWGDCTLVEIEVMPVK
jgi:hypothetical protein